MSPKFSSDVAGSGPDGRVTREDIQEKLTQLAGDVEETTNQAKPVLTYVAVGVVVLLVAAGFLLGKRRGRRKSTVVEIRRV